MPYAAVDQSNFLGGEWGPLSMGRHDDPRYSTALALSLNGYPVEEGAWTKRGGTQFIVPTAKKRTYANLLPFEGSETCSFGMEFTNLNLRLITQTGVVCTNDAQTINGVNVISGALYLSGTPTWAAGDLFQLVFPDASSPLYPYSQAQEVGLRSQVFMISGLTAHTNASGWAAFSANPANNDTLVIDATTITFGTDVTIAGTLAGTLTNLLTFLHAAGAPLNTMTYGLDSSNTVLVIYANSAGTGANSNTLSTTSAVITVSASTLLGGSTTGSTLTFSDDLGVALSINWPYNALVGAQVLRHKQIVTPYTGVPVLSGLRAIQAEVNSIILSSTQPPYELQITTQGTLSADPVFAWSKLTMVDGPYLDPQVQTLSLSALTGAVTATAGSAVFAATDVGRSMRIFTQPAVYNPASTYSAGNFTTDSTGAWWVATGAVNAGTYPGTTQLNAGVATLVWAPAPTAGSWAWGVITAYSSSTIVTLTFDTTIPGMVLATANGTTAFEWQLGVYSGTTGYPTCGVFYEGRLWLAGAVPNRFDTTTSNGVSQVIGTNTAAFSPTDPFGNVLDSSGISLTLNSSGINQIQWMMGDQGGVLMGTLHGETLVSASTLGDPLTPTSIQAHEHTRFGSTAGVDAIRAGATIVFQQRSQRRIMEFIYDSFSGKPVGRHLNEHAKHLSTSGVARLAYLEEPTPIVWALMQNGMLVGCTYRRFSRFAQTPPEAAGWHWNIHGAGRIFTSMCTVPSADGLFERLFVVTNVPPPDPNQNGVANFFIEVMQPALDPAMAVTQDWFLDQVGGAGVGNSGSDCGGMNASGFTQTGFFKGADTTANGPVDSFAGFSAGQSPPWGGVNLLGKGQSVFFPGSVALYNVPKNKSANTTSLSMSVWVGTGDFPMASGMLFSSPSLSFAQAQPGTDITSGLLGWSPVNYGSGSTALAMCSNGLDYPAPCELDAVFTGTGFNWAHLMISAKTDGAGNIVVTAYINDTQIYLNSNQSAGSVGNNNPMWSFSSQQDNNSVDNGLNVWSIGGQQVQDPHYTINATYTNQPFNTGAPQTFAQLVASIVGYKYPMSIGAGPSQGIITKASILGFKKAAENIIAQATGSGGPCNIPWPTSLGAETGYIGNVAELWIKAGTYIDWSSAGNRTKFHEKDSVSGSWGPIPLGTSGTTPGFGTPLVYLSGNPRNFILNRATITGSTGATALTEIDTRGAIIDYDTGITGGLVASNLSFP